MSFVIIGGERLALELGETVLGGGGEGALGAAALAHLPPFAIIAYPVGGESTIRALGPLAPTLNGAPLGTSQQPLRHGDQIAVGELVIAYGEMQAAGHTRHRLGPAGEASPDALAPSTPTAASGGRLVHLRDGSVHDVPARGLSIGRDPDSDIALASKDVSRTHATIAPALLGYTLTDRSANGVRVNGARIEGSRVLGQGDVIRIGAEEFRFEADAASFEPALPPDEHPLPPGVTPVPRPHGGDAGATLLASLEVVSGGALEGARFRIERPTVQLGRGPRNDVQLQDASVSGSHASLVLRGRTWYVLDLESRNGTFVEGEAVKGQRALPSVCELRLGTLTLLFRAINEADTADNGTIGVIGLATNQRKRR